MVAGPSALYETSGSVIRQAVTQLLERGAASGDVRPDIEAADIMQALAGLAYNIAGPGWKKSALRLIDVIIAGLRPEASGGSRARKPKGS